MLSVGVCVGGAGCSKGVGNIGRIRKVGVCGNRGLRLRNTRVHVRTRSSLFWCPLREIPPCVVVRHVQATDYAWLRGDAQRQVGARSKKELVVGVGEMAKGRHTGPSPMTTKARWRGGKRDENVFYSVSVVQ